MKIKHNFGPKIQIAIRFVGYSFRLEQAKTINFNFEKIQVFRDSKQFLYKTHMYFLLKLGIFSDF